MTTRRVLGTNIQCCKLVQLYCVPGRQLKRCRRIDVPLHCWLRSQRQRRHPDMHRLRRRHLQPGRRALHQSVSRTHARTRESGSGVLTRCAPRLASALSPVTFADCSANTFSNNIASECTTCPTNSFSTAGSSVCTCSAGYISPTGLTNLTACSGKRREMPQLYHTSAHYAHAHTVRPNARGVTTQPAWLARTATAARRRAPHARLAAPAPTARPSARACPALPCLARPPTRSHALVRSYEPTTCVGTMCALTSHLYGAFELSVLARHLQRGRRTVPRYNTDRMLLARPFHVYRP